MRSCSHICLFGRLMPTYGVLGMAGLGFGLLAALLRCKRFGLSRDDCAYLYILGRWGPWWGPSCSTCSPSCPGWLWSCPCSGRSQGSSMPAISPAAWCFTAAFSAVWRRPGGGQIFKAPPVRLLPGAGARPASGARRGAGRLFLRRLLLWTGGSAPLGHSIHSRHCRAQRRAPSSGAALGGGGGAGDFRLSALVCRAGRRAGADAPGLCVLLCPGAVCVGVVSGGSGPGMYGPFSTSQWLSLVVLALALAWPVAGRKLKKYGRERVSQQKGNRDKSDSAHS